MVEISSWNMILISNDFWHKRKMYNFDSYNVLLSIATNIAVLLMTAGVGIFLDLWLLCVIFQEIPDVAVGLVLSN